MTGIQSVTLLVGTDTLPTYMFEALRRIEEQTPASIELLVLTTPLTTDDNSLVSRCVGAVKKVLKPVLGTEQQWIPIDEIEFLSTCETVRVDPEQRAGVGVDLPDEIIDRIAAETDVVVHYGVGILKGDILYKPNHGVIGFHHGDIRYHRGAQAGFWEFIRDEPTAGVTLQQYTSELDSGRIICLEQIDIRDAHSWGEVRNRMYAASEPMIAEAITKVNDPDFSPETVPSDDLGEMHYSFDMTWFVRLQWLIAEIRGRI
jgi:folate-dependent phosphoribosylglycinamide formyltransferase PurN